MAFDGYLGGVVLFGGATTPGDQFNNTWLWDGANWIKLHPASSPVGRWAAAMAYDPLDQGLVLFGGYGVGTLGDTWLLVPTPVQ